ncbi:MerR family transcriptional regulator [Acetivibrio cellulolyticus]|uniref:MerR family transcriptional regulator n=1 Tax=Acetivibrio cellulolyticus TaxID=35830 RepID=UPI0001E30137|nr:MerR family transcriptional regulator [Acetivibrio cellulolyticus]
MPDVRNCKRCNKIFNYIGGAPICQDCKQLDEVNFKKVKEYLYDHPRSSLFDVSKELEISVQQIKVYLKEGRLEIVGSEGNMILECERCGKSITTGRFCNECSKEVTNDIKSTADQMNKSMPKTEEVASKRTNGMRYLNKND